MQDFAASMGLSYEEIRSRFGLVDTLLRYHVIAGRKLTGQGLVTGGPPRTAKPLTAMSNPKDVLRFQRLANGTIAITDVQNNTAHVAGQPIMLPRANIFPVDRVLLNGDVFNNVATLLQFHPGFSSLAALLPRAPGLAGSFRTNTFNYTLLAPTNDALAAASASVPSDVQGLPRVLQYHVIARPGTLPDNFTQGAPLSTLLPGNNLTIRYRRVTVPARFNSSRNISFTTATIVPGPDSPGGAANVTSANLFSGRGTVQGIDRVLLPAQAASNASEAAGAGTNSTSTAAAGRRLLGMSIMSAPHASAAHLLGDALAAGSITRGRQLLGFGSGRAKGYGGGDDSDSSTECNQGVCSGSMFYDDLQNASDAQYSGSAIDAGDEF
ncbi:hypothetical protein OEZ85_008789 [Tetradesmus obliquus]|uniref:FAS1 domain-containing protein n=1 Tax=Tetradesmus obliquus TaxID=3088 RepID=A0ABY8TLW7_TETOB|nr:hypothetical protein OEZ85_008789 [Tetradesmus obliquus]